MITTSTRPTVTITLFFLLLLLTSAHSIRLYYNDSQTHTLTLPSYPSHNIFLSSNTTLQLTNGATITAPPTVNDGESTVRIDDATFTGVNGTITGGATFGGVGITISSSRDGITHGTASFANGMYVYGGEASRSSTTQGGDAIQVLQSGSMAIFTGGEIVAGKGCSREICGVNNNNGNAVKVIMGTVVIMGGRFDGDFYNLQGLIRLFGCVELKDNGGRIGGVLSDGSEIDVVYVGEEEGLEVEFDESVCPVNKDVVEVVDDPEASAGAHQSRRWSSLLVMATVMLVAMS